MKKGIIKKSTIKKIQKLKKKNKQLKKELRKANKKLNYQYPDTYYTNISQLEITIERLLHQNSNYTNFIELQKNKLVSCERKYNRSVWFNRILIVLLAILVVLLAILVVESTKW